MLSNTNSPAFFCDFNREISCKPRLLKYHAKPPEVILFIYTLILFGYMLNYWILYLIMLYNHNTMTPNNYFFKGVNLKKITLSDIT